VVAPNQFLWGLDYFKYAPGSEQVSDILSGFDNTFANHGGTSLNAAPQALQGTTDVVSDDDRFIYFVRARDRSGNVALFVSEPIIVDTAAPDLAFLDVSGAMSIPQSGIYTDDVVFKVRASDVSKSSSSGSNSAPVDVSSGLRPSLEWELCKGNAVLGSGTAAMNSAADLSGSVISSLPDPATWTDISGRSTGFADISISKDDYQHNGMVLKVRATDNAGNASADWLESEPFSIDSTGPVVEVSFDNNDVANGKYFKADRVQTIRVTDNNFSESLIRIGSTPYGGWQLVAQGTPGAPDEDSKTYERTIAYTTDGDFAPAIAGTDLAGNPLSVTYADGTAAPTEFTVDKTFPQVSVTYDVNGGANGRYFSTARNATITINEHNFFEAGVQVTGTVSMGGNSTALQAPASWRTDGDIHTASMAFTADADYTFTISVTDLAGNVSAEYPLDVFTVDTTPPLVSIFGVEDKSANNDRVAPVISFMDANFDPALTSYTLTGLYHGEVGHAVTVEDRPDGRTVSFEDFDRVKAEDDLYTLTASISDLAGNTASDAVSFSVNRFGSVYVLDDSVLPILGTYTRDERDIIFQEINVDSLEPQTIKVTSSCNGQTSVLGESSFTMRRTSALGDWAKYEYTVPKENFAADGCYQLIVYSVDRAGNVNENIAPQKAMEINFAIDKTPPVIIATGVASGGSYDTNSQPVDVSVKDNLKLVSVEVSVNGALAEYKVTGDSYTFDIPAADTPQDISITATDAAGNTSLCTMDNVVVTTNPLLRWYYNTPLFIGSIAALGVLLIGGALFWWFFFVYNRRRFDDEEEQAAADAAAKAASLAADVASGRLQATDGA
jgi:hypothetical protein